MIPDSCPSKATVGEKRTFGLLRDGLPDHFVAWYEPVVAGRYPDFCLIADDFGLLMLEVKGWYAGQVARANDHEIELHKSEGDQTRVEVHKHPIRQVREYLFGLVDQLARPEHALLLRHEGKHRGKPCFPCGFGVLLTNITRARLVEAGLAPIFPSDRVLCRDELASLEGRGDREVINRLKSLFAVRFPFDPLTEDQIRTLKGALHREVVVRRRPSTTGSVPKGQPLLPGAVALEVLDAQQEREARSLGSGHHVVFGVAGSGKTVLLLARARLIAERDPGRKVLVLCYNRVLAASLAAQLGEPDLRSAEVRHFHSWAARKTGLRLRDDESFDVYESRAAALIGGAGHFAEAEKYDAILIDEGHDFEPDWFRCTTNLLKGGPEGDLLVAVDGAQSLYGRARGFTWTSVGVEAKGRSRRLSRNYRNTKQILEFAWQAAQSVIQDVEETETHVRVLPTKASRQGSVPIYRGCASIAEEHALIARLVGEFRAKGLAGRDIAVLYPRREGNRVDAFCRWLGESGEVCWVSNEADPELLVRPLEDR
jgi:hypothetical protein